MTGWIIALIIAATVGSGGVLGWSYVAKEHAEARSVSIGDIDFSSLPSGTFTGEYEGGMYKWRANRVKVTIDSGMVTNIELMSSTDPGDENSDYTQLYRRVLDAQSLQVDAISGATLTSRAYLKGIENALLNAQR